MINELPVVYTKENCVQCTATKRRMDKKGIQYDTIDVSQNSDVRDLLIEEGFTQMPVVKWRNVSWSGYVPEKIDEIPAV